MILKVYENPNSETRICTLHVEDFPLKCEKCKAKLTCLRLQKWNTIIVPRLKRQGRLAELRTTLTEAQS